MAERASPDVATATLTSGNLLARNVGINMLGWVLPAVAALVAVPVLVRGLGEPRFGLLALAWTTLGYFALFDLGLGRAVTHAVSERMAVGRDRELPGVLWSALAVLVPLGVIGAVVLLVLAPWLVGRVLEIPPALHAEALRSFRILAIAIPFVGGAAVLRGILESQQRFGIVNAIRVPYGVLLFLAPALALPWSRSLVPAVVILVLVRVLLFVALFMVVARTLPNFAAGSQAVTSPAVRSLVAYGGWMTVSGVVSPLMNTFDQFVIGAVLTVSLVTHYASPFELVTKLWLFTVALYPVFFAALASTGQRDRARTAALYDRMLRVTFAAMFVPVLAFVALAPEILGAWLGPEFTGDSARVLQIVAIGVFVNLLGQGALNLVQALGRPDLTAKYHLAELPIYATLLWVLLGRYGIVGVAMAWSIRAIGDAVLLLFTGPRLLSETRGATTRVLAGCAMAVAAFVAVMTVPTTVARMAIVALAIPVWIALTWFVILQPAERSLLSARR